jgi:hypothetical protein
MPTKPFDYFWDSFADEKEAKERANYVLKRRSRHTRRNEE